MNSNNGWPLFLAITLLCLLTLLSIATWSGNNPFFDQFSLGEKTESATSESATLPSVDDDSQKISRIRSIEPDSATAKTVLETAETIPEWDYRKVDLLQSEPAENTGFTREAQKKIFDSLGAGPLGEISGDIKSFAENEDSTQWIPEQTRLGQLLGKNEPSKKVTFPVNNLVQMPAEIPEIPAEITVEPTKEEDPLVVAADKTTQPKVETTQLPSFVPPWSLESDDEVVKKQNDVNRRVDTDLDETKTVESPKIESQAIELQTLEPQQVESQAIKSQNVESQTVESQTVESQTVESPKVESQQVDSKIVESEAIASQTVASKIAEAQAIESKTVEPETVEPENVEPETVQSKTAELPKNEPKTVELKTIEPESVQLKTIEPAIVEPQKLANDSNPLQITEDESKLAENPAESVLKAEPPSTATKAEPKEAKSTFSRSISAFDMTTNPFRGISDVKPAKKDLEASATTENVATESETKPKDEAVSMTPPKRVEKRDLVVAKSVRQPVEKPADTVPPQVTWPVPQKLVNDLKPLAEYPGTKQWATKTLELIGQLTKISDPADAQVSRIIKDSYRQIQELDRTIIQVSEIPANRVDAARGQLVTRLRYVRYELQRRLEVWTAAYRLAAATERHFPEAAKTAQFASARKLNFDLVPQDWIIYLQLEDLGRIINDPSASQPLRKKISRQVLTRATSNFLTESQFTYVEKVVEGEVATYLRMNASQPTDIMKLLSAVEKFELDANGFTQYYLNDHFTNLYWSPDVNANNLADTLNAHYRNANFRVEVSEQFINRMLPSMPQTREPVNDRILNAAVRGQSLIKNKMQIDLISDPQQWRIRLRTLGRIASRTRAHRDGFTFHNVGDAQVHAEKDIVVGMNGPSTHLPTQVSARSQQRLVGLNSKYDRFPVLGDFARRIARQKHMEQEPIAKANVESKMRTATQQRVEAEVQKNLNQISASINRNLIQPLSQLELEPTTVEMKTTDERMILRYRLAGKNQLSANTARPIPMNTSVLSTQIHESMINNMLGNIGIAGEKFTVEEFVTHLNKMTRSNGFRLDDRVPRDVELTFGKIDPIRFDFDDRHVTVTLRLKRLKIGNSSWKNLTVIAPYDVQAQGFDIKLTRRGTISLEGHRLRLRGQLAMRTVFQELLKESYQFSAVDFPLARKVNLDGLWISQIVFAEGWMGISLNDSSSMMPNRTSQKSRAPQR